jgi:hypothetical protein
VVVIRFALLVKHRIHIGDTLASQLFLPPCSFPEERRKKKIFHLVRNKPKSEKIFAARIHVISRQPRHRETYFMQEMWLEWSQRDKQREHWNLLLFLGCINNQYLYTSDTCI